MPLDSGPVTYLAVVNTGCVPCIRVYIHFLKNLFTVERNSLKLILKMPLVLHCEHPRGYVFVYSLSKKVYREDNCGTKGCTCHVGCQDEDESVKLHISM